MNQAIVARRSSLPRTGGAQRGDRMSTGTGMALHTKMLIGFVLGLGTACGALGGACPSGLG
jgi:hypothetical protein